MKKINIAINGFGRIGRSAFKIISENYPNLKVVAINDLAEVDNLVYLLKYDTVYGEFSKEVEILDDAIKVGRRKTAIFAERDPKNLPWKKLKVDVVLECTGVFRDKESLSAHLEAGAKKVVLSSPARGAGIKMLVPGVNESKLNKSDHIISCASCTTNCLAPATELLRKKFGIKKALMTTIHSYTAGQNLIDGSNKDKRRGRAAALNMVPTTTGAAIATTQIIPSLKGSFDGLAVRVPTAVGSLCDTVYLLKKKTTIEAVNNLFIKASETNLKGILTVSDEEIVSSDVIGDSHSTIIDLPSTKLIDGDLLKVISWYDNEWAYSARLVELAIQTAEYIKK